MYLHPSMSKDTPEIFRKNVLRRVCSNSWISNQASFALEDCVIEGNAEQKPIRIKGGKILEKSIYDIQITFLFTVPTVAKHQK